MLVKKDNYYSRVELLEDGRVLHYQVYDDKVLAMNDSDVMEVCSDIDDLLDGGYTFLPPDLETMSVGDIVQHMSGMRRVLMAQGVGQYRTYALSHTNDHARYTRPMTAEELKTEEAMPLPWPNTELESISLEEAEKQLGKKIKV